MNNNINPPPEIIDHLKTLLNNRKFSEAFQKADTIIKQHPKSFILWNILGVSLYELKKFDDAIKSYQKAIYFNSKYAHAYINLGIALRVQGKLDEAINISKKAVLIEPHNPLAYNNLGALFTEQGKFDEAIKVYKKVILLQPNYAEAYNNLGVALRELGKVDEAIETYKKALTLHPDYSNAYNNLSAVLRDKGEFNEAIEACKKAISLQSDYAEPYYNLGVLLKDKGDFNESKEACKKAITLQPDYAEAYNNLGNVLLELGKLDEAIASYNQAIELKSDYAEAYYNLSFPYNLKGDFKKGLKLYESRLSRKKTETRIPRDHLIWDGKKSILGKKFFVYEEQGLGDIIQFCRYLLLVKQKGAEVIFSVKPKMHTLLKTLDKDIVFVDIDPDENSIDFETPLMSLPYLFNTDLNSIPSMTSYLSVDHDRVISWKNRLAKDSFKIGICWQGSKTKIDFGRSFPLTLFKDISKLPNVELISLHKGEGEKQIEDINFDLKVLGNDFDNGEDAFIDSAAVISNCDLIITSDTAIAHLSGALGCPTWVVLKKIPDWRWMLDRNDSPWYTSMKLYRQKERDDWEEVFKTIKKDLKSFIKLNEN